MERDKKQVCDECLYEFDFVGRQARSDYFDSLARENLALQAEQEKVRKLTEALNYIDNKIKFPCEGSHALLMLEHSKDRAQQALKEIQGDENGK